MLIIYSARQRRHLVDENCPEKPERIEFLDGLVEQEVHSLIAGTQEVKLDLAPNGERFLTLFHTQRYIDSIRDFCSSLKPEEARKRTAEESDNWYARYSYLAACHAVGAAVKAAKLARQGQNSFAAVRPPGHHAQADQDGGFCIFNNMAIATEYLRRSQKRKNQRRATPERIIILDLDLHLGDGTLDYAQDRERVFYFSINHENLWPYQHPEDSENTEHIFLPEGTEDDRYINILEERLIPAIRRFKPTIIAVSMGFDTHHLDHEEFGGVLKGGFDLTQRSYATLREILYETALPHFYVLEGGYNPKSVEEGMLSICQWT
ncbi:MAG TPA: histone deacetylase [Candidatus Nanoarchaeia archaeon]|nr:histone deacetylase [Candidatus Nanoarchaeia archaeon]